MVETWRDIPGYEGYYQASDLGQIRSVDRESFNGHTTFTLKGKLLKQNSAGKMGYRQVALSKDCKPKTYRVHVLVALTFHGIRPPNHDVGHIDGNPLNNQALNLAYMTRRANIHQSYQDSGLGADRNKGKGRLIEFQGVSLNINGWAKKIGCHPDALNYREKMGWSVKRMLTEPVKKKTKDWKNIEYQGKIKTLSEWAKEGGLKEATLKARLKAGVPIDVALKLPAQAGKKINF